MIPVVAIVGKPGAGKTVLIEKLIGEFKSRGYRVAAVKHSHKAIEADSPGKDTWRFTRAGSDASVISSVSGTAFFRNEQRELELPEVMAALGEGYDIAIVEGFKQSKAPKIEVLENGQAAMSLGEQYEQARASRQESSAGTPRYSRDDVKEIADLIQKEIIEKSPPGMEIMVNGKPVFMKPFVKNIIGSSILAMISSLKTVGIIRNVRIIMRNKT
jgi:molybdopterin-guanine dinucleotide biosynthesis adapter protein